MYDGYSAFTDQLRDRAANRHPGNLVALGQLSLTRQARAGWEDLTGVDVGREVVGYLPPQQGGTVVRDAVRAIVRVFHTITLTTPDLGKRYTTLPDVLRRLIFDIVETTTHEGHDVGTRITEQLAAIARQIQDFRGDPDYPEFARLAEGAECHVAIPGLLERYADRAGSIDIERARRELGPDEHDGTS